MKAQVLAIALLASYVLVAAGQPSPELKQGPVQAELLAHLNVRHLTTSSTIFARVTLDWASPECVLRQGAILEAKVELAEAHKYRHESRLALSFVRAQCNGTDMHPLELMLAAVADAPANWAIVPDSQVRMPISFSNPHGNGMLAGIGTAAPGDLYSTHLELTGITHRFPMRPDLQPGAVLGIKHLKLDLGTGPNRASVLSSRGSDVALGAYTQILLVPASLAFQPSRAAFALRTVPATANTPASTNAVVPADTLETCAPPGCAVDLPISPNELAGDSRTSISVRSIGYTPRSNKVLDDFDNEEALAWLGSDQLLFTFNPHRLIHRQGPTAQSAGPVRVVRAVLLNTQSKNIVRAVDWQIADARRYLWQLDGGRVLAHIGQELRIYTAGLELEQAITLTGPLSFVRITPDGHLIAIATLRERHSPDLHASLRETTGMEPEEDVEIAILDAQFKTMAQFSTVSGIVPPTLLNEGQVHLLARPNMAYRLALNTWDNKTTTLAHFQSRCTPQLSSMAPDLLFLLTCNPPDGATVYRVLRSDGKMLLRGKSDPRSVGLEAVGNSGSQTFAMSVVFADRELSPGAAFKGSELEFQELRIHAARDGKRVTAFRVNKPSTSRGSYALSPSGSQLAVLAREEIRLFELASH